jgi:hypothetical protein
MIVRPVPVLAAAAAEVLGLLAQAGERACLIGGLVVSRWGQPRATADVDFSVLAPYGDEAPVLDILLAHFSPRRPDAREFALLNRVLLLETADAVPVDVALAAFPFELEALDQASMWDVVPDVRVLTCAAEHLVVYKLVAARPQDLIDVEGVVRRQRERLDVKQIRFWGGQFAELKEDPDLLRPFEEALKVVGLS